MSPTPTIAVVVAVRDEERAVGSLVRSLRSQAHSPAEIVFVDGGSTDRTVAAIVAAAEGDERVRVVSAGPATPGRGRNVGVQASTAPWIAFVDAGIDVDEHWLARLSRFAGDGVDVVYGMYEPVVTGAFSEVAALAYVGPSDPTPVGRVRSRSIASCLLRREVFEAVGGFPDLRAAEDRIFMARVDDLGFRVTVSPEATARWHLQPNLQRTFQRFRTYSKHNVLAGEQRNWHYGVARQYAVALPLLVASLRWRKAGAIAVVGLLARGERSIWLRRGGRSPVWACNPLRVAAVAGLLAVIDAATFVGWAEAIVERRRART